MRRIAGKLAMFVLFHLCLKFLIMENYRLREAGALPDEWYWADRWALKYGFVVDPHKS